MTRRGPQASGPRVLDFVSSSVGGEGVERWRGRWCQWAPSSAKAGIPPQRPGGGNLPRLLDGGDGAAVLAVPDGDAVGAYQHHQIGLYIWPFLCGYISHIQIKKIRNLKPWALFTLFMIVQYGFYDCTHDRNVSMSMFRQDLWGIVFII